MKNRFWGLVALIVLSAASISGGQSPATGVRVQGRVTGIPVDGPPGLIRVTLRSAGREMEVGAGPEGAFEFAGVAAGRVVLSSRPITAELSIDVGTKDIEGLELTARNPQLVGQVTIDSGVPLPANRDPLAPVFRLEARGAGGNIVWHQFVRSDGVFGFLPLTADDYQIRTTLIPAGYAVKSISYRGVDALRSTLNLDPAQPYGFLRVVLTAAASSATAGVTGPPPATAEVAPATGDSSLVVSQSGRGPEHREGSVPFFTVRSTGNGGFREERQLGGERCSELPARIAAIYPGRSPTCQPTGPSGSDRTVFSLSAGTYEISGYVRACSGNCGALAPPTEECRAAFTISRGETLYADRVQSDRGPCLMAVSSKPPNGRE